MKSLFPVFACGLLTLAGCGTSTESGSDSESPGSVSADQGKPDSEEKSASETLAANAPAPDEQLKAIQEKYDEEYTAFRSAMRSAKTPKDRMEVQREKLPDADAYADQMFELVDAHPESEVAVDALVWVSQRARGAKGDEATARLVSEYPNNDKTAPVVMMMRYSQGADTKDQLRELLGSENRTIQAVSSFTLGSMLMKDGDSRDEGVALLEKVVNEYEDASFAINGRTYEIAPRAEGALFEATKLQIGMEAPDIEAADLDGVEFKLSDYRGKVVLLDFWGNW